LEASLLRRGVLSLPAAGTVNHQAEPVHLRCIRIVVDDEDEKLFRCMYATVRSATADEPVRGVEFSANIRVQWVYPMIGQGSYHI